MRRLLGLLLLSCVPLAAQVPVVGSTVDAKQGFQYQGAAPNNFMLCGNGSLFLPSATCGATAYYQTIQAGGIAVPQRAAVNFDSTFFAVTDDSGNNRTNVSLKNPAPINIHGNADTATNATNAANANAVGGVALAGLCQTGGTGCPTVAPVAGSVTNVTGGRFSGTAYHNTNAFMIFASGYFTTSGSAWGQVDCLVGASSPTMLVDSNQYGATTSGQTAGFRCMVPAGWFYEINTSGSASFSPGAWYETSIH